MGESVHSNGKDYWNASGGEKMWKKAESEQGVCGSRAGLSAWLRQKKQADTI